MGWPSAVDSAVCTNLLCICPVSVRRVADIVDHARKPCNTRILPTHTTSVVTKLGRGFVFVCTANASMTFTVSIEHALPLPQLVAIVPVPKVAACMSQRSRADCSCDQGKGVGMKPSDQLGHALERWDTHTPPCLDGPVADLIVLGSVETTQLQEGRTAINAFASDSNARRCMLPMPHN